MLQRLGLIDLSQGILIFHASVIHHHPRALGFLCRNSPAVCWVVLSCAGHFQVLARLFSPRVAPQHPYLGDNRAVPWLTQVIRVARPQTAQHQVRAGDP